MDTLRILEGINLFRGLFQEQLNSIARLCEYRNYKANEVIFAEKTSGKEMYVITKGQVRIELGIKGKTDCATIHRVREGEVFGELALLGEGRRSATARCETDCEVIALGQNALREVFNKDNRAGYLVMMNLASLLATRLRKTNLQLVACFVWE